MNPRPKLLLIEDNRLLRWALLIELYEAGYWVAAPETIAEALQWASSVRFDALVTDWRLPVGHDGFEMLERVSANSPCVLPVLISAEANDELAMKARAAGFKHVLVKPFLAQQLRESLYGAGGPVAQHAARKYWEVRA